MNQRKAQLRRMRLALDNWECLGCGRRDTKRLQLHHVRYKHKGHPDPMVELRDVRTFCDECHGKLHSTCCHCGNPIRRKAANDGQYELPFVPASGF